MKGIGDACSATIRIFTAPSRVGVGRTEERAAEGDGAAPPEEGRTGVASENALLAMASALWDADANKFSGVVMVREDPLHVVLVQEHPFLNQSKGPRPKSFAGGVRGAPCP